ncbi:hypothetical protein [Glutamicibacter sp. PS]|uniref:hypothetical protein n=1 Tax=Glutamicibacter sp. PS TaxID=3075634 RepID=UPI00284B1A18|nr:hypothetical protein [Glutamicibacter sp. PS]MDR4533481.1 hypothetical protein [Glutamicibacter sp. PS]
MTYSANSEYGRLYFCGVSAEEPAEGVYGGLVQIDDEGQISVLVATMYGAVRVTGEQLRQAPETIDPEWEDVTELSVTKAHDDPFMFVSEDEIDDPEEFLPAETVGSYRLQISRRGQGIPEGEVCTGPSDPRIEDVVVRFWPDTEMSGFEVRRSTSQFGVENQAYFDEDPERGIISLSYTSEGNSAEQRARDKHLANIAKYGEEM